MLPSRSRRTLGILVTTATLVATGVGVADAAAAKTTPPKPFRNTSIVLQKSEGGIALGASKAATQKIFGASNCTVAPTGGGCFLYGRSKSYSVSASFDMKTKAVDQIVFQSQSLAKAAQIMRTSKQIHIGSTLTQLKKAYPKVKRSNGPGLGTFYRITSGHRYTQFVFDMKNQCYEIDLFLS